MSERVFLKRWKKECYESIKLVHPEWDKDTVYKYLDKIIDKKLKNPECALNNNYRNKTARTTLLDLFDYIDKTKPVIASGGVLFKNQHEAINPPSFFLDGALKKRKSIKKGLKYAVPGSYEYMMIDLKQLTEKVVANSYYGASGNETSPFYNLYTALSTTSCGQSLISCMMCSFENFFAGNTNLYDIDDFYLYLKNSIDKSKIKFNIEIKDMPVPSETDLMKKVFSMFKDKAYLKDKEVLEKIAACINNLNDLEKQRFYYSSNLFEFIKIKSIEKLFLNAIYELDTFKDPNAVPDYIKDSLDYLWEILLCWVVYNYPTYNRINKLKYEKRKCVVVIDTDSNMLNIDKWMKYWDNIIDIDKTKSKDLNEIMYIKCNILCYILTKYTEVILNTFSINANIPEDYRPRLNMKNEYLYLRMLLSKVKKSYCGLVRLREGNEIIPEKLDIKGMQFVKSTASLETKKYFEKLSRDILYSNPISGSEVLKRVKAFIKYIDNSILTGEKRFLNPLAVKEPEAYAKPFSNQGIRGTYVWNLLYPDKSISLPDKLIIAKVKLSTSASDRDNLEKLSREHPDIYNKLREGIFDNPNCGFSDKGVNVIAIPSNVELVPEWITPYIDKDKIINDNIAKYHMVLESLGLNLLNSKSNETHMTNIINF